LPSDVGEDLERFGNKLERKLRQTRAAVGVGRILFADAKESLLLGSATGPSAARLKGKLLRQHSEITAVVLLKRPAQPSKVNLAYHSVALLAEESDSDIVALIARAFPQRPGSAPGL
jgi:hypothetical protein